MSLQLRPVADALLGLGDAPSHPAGAVVAVHIDGKVHAAAAGAAVLPGAGRSLEPMRPDTVVDLASVTKVASTTALTLRLVAGGRLDLDSPVAEHLPRFADDGDPARAGVTVRHLLAHTSGLPPWLPLYCFGTDRDETLDRVARVPLDRPPGQEWAYSDLGMVLAGAVLERVTGLRQDQAFAELVAAPAGLRRTGYGPLAPEGLAAGSDGDVIEHDMVRTGRPYPSAARVEDFGGWRDEPTIGVPNDGNAAHALAGVAGHAGLFAPVTELARLGAWLVDARVQDPVVLAELLRPLDAAPDRAVGFRLAHLPIGGELVPVAWHAGFTGTVLATALDRELSVAAAATRLHGTTGRLGSPTTPQERLVQLDDVLATTWQGVARALADADAVPPAAGTTTNGAQQ